MPTWCTALLLTRFRHDGVARIGQGGGFLNIRATEILRDDFHLTMLCSIFPPLETKNRSEDYAVEGLTAIAPPSMTIS